MLSRAIVRPPGASFVYGLTSAELGAPDPARALEQHAAYCEALEACGLKLTRLDADERFPDSTFVEDTALILWGAADHAAVLTRPGASSRAGEVDSIAAALSRLFPSEQLHSIRESGTLDGGDVCETDDHFFIGVSERTNEAGARQLAELVAAYGYSSSLVDIRGVKGILHLKSGLAYLSDNRLVVIDSLANHEAFRGYELVRVNASEEYAANCVRVNDRVLVAAGFPQFERTLQALGYDTIALEMSEFQKLDGGLSCLSLRF
jgi:dimethylargininase